MLNLSSFLSSLQRSTTKIDAIVFGNQSADLDSICSSICFAYLLSYVIPHYEHCSKINIVPVINIPKEQFKLRLESQYLLNKYLNRNNDLNLEDCLLFIDTSVIIELFASQQQTQPSPFRLYLVDHNELSHQLYPSIAEKVYSIVDHHVDTKTLMLDQLQSNGNGHLKQVPILSSYEKWKGERLRWIVGPRIGSCGTMIAMLWREAIENGCIDSNIMEGNVSWILLNTILRDTLGLKDTLKGSRWGIEDAEMVRWLKRRLETNTNQNIDLNELIEKFEELKCNRQLHRSIGINGILMMDMKFFNYFPIKNEKEGKNNQRNGQENDEGIKVIFSSMTIPLNDELFNSIELQSALETVIQEKHANMIILMSCSVNIEGSIERWMGLYVPANVPNRGTISMTLKKISEWYFCLLDHLISSVTTIDFLQLQPSTLHKSIPFSEEYLLFKQVSLYPFHQGRFNCPDAVGECSRESQSS